MAERPRAFLVHADGILIGESDLESCAYHEELLQHELVGAFVPTAELELVREVFELRERAAVGPARVDPALQRRYFAEREALALTVTPRGEAVIGDCELHVWADEDGALRVQVWSSGYGTCESWAAARARGRGEAVPPALAAAPSLHTGETPPSPPARVGSVRIPSRTPTLGPPRPEPAPASVAASKPPKPPPAPAAQPTPTPSPSGDRFDELPWLARPETWHPSTEAWIEEARDLDPIIGDELDRFELWAALGGLTQASVSSRMRASNLLIELLYEGHTRPAWPVLGRCLLRVASNEVPGRFFAAYALLWLVAKLPAGARALLPAEEVEAALGGWDHPLGARLTRTLLERMGSSRNALDYVYVDDHLLDLVDDAERASGAED
ncbi:MAG: hypothetical protein R3B82_25935 [Sandaracinaceae bacterium]